MKQLLKKALRIDRPDRATHLAVLFRGSRIIAHAWNDTSKTKGICARLGYPYATVHAEVAVVLNYLKKHSSRELCKLDLLVLRRTRRGEELVDSRPCDLCFRFLNRLFPVRRVFWVEGGWVVGRDKVFNLSCV